MGKTRKAVAWISIVSTLWMGCYSSALIEPTADEKENIHTDRINFVVAKDGKKYEFEKPPVVVNDTIVGGRTKFTWRTKVNEEETLIPDSDVAWVELSPSGKTECVVTKAGAMYTYEAPPTRVSGAYVGKATFLDYGPLVMEQVSIPLSDVAEISVSRVNSGGTRTLIILGLSVAVIAATAAFVADRVRLGLQGK
jgi:hypothetical protein